MKRYVRARFAPCFPEIVIMPTLEAVRKARSLGLDLALIAPTAEPPVAKAMDYGQWQHSQHRLAH
jgi:translation initiation factor IF-3